MTPINYAVTFLNFISGLFRFGFMSMLGKIHQHLFITVCLCQSDRHIMVLEIVGVINAYFKVLQRVLEIPGLNPPTSKINSFTKNCNVLLLDK